MERTKGAVVLRPPFSYGAEEAAVAALRETILMAIRSCCLIAAALVCAAAPLPGIAAGAQPLTASPAFRTEADKVRTVLATGDLNAAAAGLARLTPSTPLEKYVAASLAMELAVKRNDPQAQRAAVTRMLESGGAPEAEIPYLNHLAGYFAARAGATDAAIGYLSRARAMGLSDPHASLLLVESFVRLRRIDDATRVLDETISARRQAGQAVPTSWHDRAASLALIRKDWAGLATASAAKLADPAMAGPDWRSAIVSYLAAAKPDADAALDLYRLQLAAGGMASERDWQAYATAAAERGYGDEAKAVIAAGLASGALSKADPVVASVQRSAQQAGRSASKAPPPAASNLTAAQASKAGDDLLAAGRFADAVPYYRAALDKGGADRDRVTTRLGIALARAGDLDGARAALAQAKGRWAEVAAFWSAWVEAHRPPAAGGAAAPG